MFGNRTGPQRGLRAAAAACWPARALASDGTRGRAKRGQGGLQGGKQDRGRKRGDGFVTSKLGARGSKRVSLEGCDDLSLLCLHRVVTHPG